MRIPVIMMICLLVGSGLIDLYIANDIRQSSGRRSWWKAYWISAFVCWIFVIVTLCLPRRSEENDILSIMWMLYSYLSIYTAKLVYIIFSLVGRLFSLIFHKRKGNRYPMRWIGLSMSLFTFIAMWWGVGVTRHEIEVKRVEIDSPRLPSSFKGYKIAQISDIHVGTWGRDTSFIKQLVDSVNSLHPDLIVFTGDIVNRRTEELFPFVTELSRLSAPDGVISILGNHDYGDYVDWKNPAERIANNDLLAQVQRSMGWDLLNNRRVVVSNGNDSIVIVGVENVGDPPFPTYGDLEKALPSSPDSAFNQNDERFKLLLTHNPAHWEDYVSHKTNIDLTLSGHTHAMQMVFKLGHHEWSPAVFRYKLWGGLYDRLNEKGEKTSLYVNIGAGEVGLPSRLFAAYPEITLFTLE